MLIYLLSVDSHEEADSHIMLHLQHAAQLKIWPLKRSKNNIYMSL